MFSSRDLYRHWIFFLWKWLLLKRERFTRKWTRETATSHNFLVSCWNCSGAAVTKQRNQHLISHYCSCVGTSFFLPLTVLWRVNTDIQQSEFLKGEKTLATPIDYEQFIEDKLWFLFSHVQSSSPSSLDLILFLLPKMVPPTFDPSLWSSFYNLGQSEMMHCIIAAFMKVFISYLKCFHVLLLCFDLQKEKESSFTGGKTATCEN